MEIVNTKWKRNFLTITIGETVSLIGSSAVQFALIWWLASETSSPIMMAFSGLTAFLPQMILGPFAGVWIDRLKRKYVVIVADLFLGLVAAGFALFFLSGNPPYWSVCVILGIRSIGNVFQMPAMQAIVPMLVPSDQLVRANGWSQLMQSGAFMLGPVLGAVMYSALPMWLTLLSDFLGACVASLCVALIAIPDPPATHTESRHFLREMKQGAKLFMQDKKLLSVTLSATACMIFFLPLSSYYPLMTTSYFKLSSYYGSVVELLYAGGMMLSALVFSWFGNIKRKFTIIHVGMLGLGITSLISGLLSSSPQAFWIFSGLCFLMGASGNVYGIPYMAYMQETLPPEAQGRAFSLIGSLMSAAMPIGLLISGPYAEKNGVPSWFVITGVAVILLITLSAFYIAYLDRKERK